MSFVFLRILITIYQMNVLSNPKNLQFLETIIIEVFYNAKDLNLLITIPNCFEILVEI